LINEKLTAEKFLDEKKAAAVGITSLRIKNPPGEGLPGGKRRYNGNCSPLPCYNYNVYF
jgi:hypothetical protein